MKANTKWGAAASIAAALTAAGITSPLSAQEADEAKLLDRLSTLESEIQELKVQLEAAKEQGEKTKKVAEAADKKASKVSKAPGDVMRNNSWHLAGYADVGMEFSDVDGDTDTFTSGKFNPAFHFQFKDLVLFESELEISTSEAGSTEVVVEYSQLDFLLHDNAALVVGKFLSPVGQFTERLHPSWINRSVNAPVGFGHGGIQPISEVGAMLRGGVNLKDKLFTYSLAVGNGPRMGHDGVEVEGFGRDDNNNKAVSGRFAFLPFDDFEIGGSFLTGKVTQAVEEEEAEEAHGIQPQSPGAGGSGEGGATITGDYDLWGVDMAYTRGNWDVRAEYLKSKLKGLGDDDHGEPEPTSYEAWYAQAAYRLSGITDSAFVHKLEPVVRYGGFTVNGDHELEDELNQKRWTVGVNYWFSPSVVFKTGLEFRNYESSHREDDTRLQFLLSYGF